MPQSKARHSATARVVRGAGRPLTRVGVAAGAVAFANVEVEGRSYRRIGGTSTAPPHGAIRQLSA